MPASIAAGDPVSLLKELIRRPSVTPTEAGVFDVLERALTPLGFTTTRLRFEGKGMPDVNNPQRRGDLIAPVVVVTPRTLTPRQRELLEELAAIENKQVSAERKSFFDKVRDYFRGEDKKS